MARPASENDKMVTLRLPHRVLDECERLAPLVSQPGIPATRADVLRHAVTIGLAVITRREKRGGIPERGAREKKPKRRASR